MLGFPMATDRGFLHDIAHSRLSVPAAGNNEDSNNEAMRQLHI
jgi:hypothetical protein